MVMVQHGLFHQLVNSMNCLDQLIQIPSLCERTTTSVSGSYSIFDIRGFSIGKAARINNDILEDVEATLYNIRKLAVNRFTTDLSIFLQGNGYQVNMADHIHDSQKNDTVIGGYSAIEIGKIRGIRLTQKVMCRTKKLKIRTIKILGQNTGLFNLVIYNSGIRWDIPINLVAGVYYVINESDIYALLGSELFARRQELFIGIDGTNFNPAVIIPDCGCQGSKNDCADVKGFSGSLSSTMNYESNTATTYGIQVEFSCSCNWNDIICQLTNSHPAAKQLLLYLCEKFWNEKVIYSDRLNLFTTFGKEDAKELLDKIEGEYAELFNNFCAGLGSFFKTGQFDDCITCNNPLSIKTNY